MSAVGWLERPLTAIALCWRLVRPDGVALGFTSHDRDIRLNGLLFRSKPGMTPSAASQDAELTPDSMDVDGVLDDDSIRGFDLDAGRWQDARVELLACDWEDGEAAPIRLMRGKLGQASHVLTGSKGAYQIELRGAAHSIDAVSAVELSPTCRASLGDGRCGVDMGRRQRRLIAIGGSGTDIHFAEALHAPADLAGGRVRILDGVLAGQDFPIAEAVEGDLRLDRELAAGMGAGTRVLLMEGCDKRFATCRGRFANAEAFDGEPHVPGIDALMRYVDP